MKVKKWNWNCSGMSDSQWPHGLQPTRHLCPWDFPGKSTGVGCHCLLREQFLEPGNYATNVSCWYCCIVYLDLIVFVCARLFQSCPILSDLMDSSLPGSSVHGILQTRTVKWVAEPSSRGSFQPRDQTSVSHVYCNWQMGSLPLWPAGKPLIVFILC